MSEEDIEVEEFEPFEFDAEDTKLILEAAKIYTAIEANVGVDNEKLDNYSIQVRADHLVGIIEILFDLAGAISDIDIEELLESAAVERDMVIAAAVAEDKPPTIH